MSEQRTQPQNGAQAQETVALPDDILARIVTETERQVSARASRPSPVHLRTWEEIERFAERAAISGMVPKDYVRNPAAICIAVQMGAELGLSPMMALKGIAVINGRPSVYGDVAIGLCRQSGKASYLTEGFTDGAGDDLTYWCEAKRKDDPNPIRRTFSVADAKKARLWSKPGPWTEYPKRMLAMRARGFCLRDAFPDVLEGLITVEEAQDIPFEDTGLTVTMPPVATQQPIRGAGAGGNTSVTETPAAKPRRTWATVLDEIEADAAAAQTAEDLDELGLAPVVQHGRANGSAAVQDRIARIFTFHRSRLSAPVDDGSSAAEPDMDSDEALGDVMPEGWVTPTAPEVDFLGQEAAQLIAAYRAAPNLGALEAIRTVSTGTMITMQALLKAERHHELRQIEAAYAARRAELAPG